MSRRVAFGHNGEVSSSLVPRLGPRRVRSYLREDLLFGKSFSRCQPAAGRTELTARTPQFLFPLPLPSSTSGLRLFLVYLPSLTLLLANTLYSSSIRRACIYVLRNSESRFLRRWPPPMYRNFVMLLRFDCELRQCKLNNGARYDYLRHNCSSSYRYTNSRLSVKRSQRWIWFIMKLTVSNISSSTE